MNWIQVSDLPIVKKIINSAQKKIQETTGVNVVLTIVEYPFLTGDKNAYIKDYVQKMICNYFKVNWDIVKGACREQHYIDARWAYAYIMVVIYGQSFSKTGKDVDKDHTAIMYAVEKVKGYIYMKTEYAKTISELIKMLPE
jgi:chromosomal replication initiation ATPase DnaA